MDNSILSEIGERLAKHRLLKPYSMTRKRVPTKKNPNPTEKYTVTPFYRVSLYEKTDYEDMRDAGNAKKLFSYKEFDVYHMEQKKKFSELTSVDSKTLTGTDCRYFAVYDRARPLFGDYINKVAASKLPRVENR